MRSVEQPHLRIVDSEGEEAQGSREEAAAEQAGEGAAERLPTSFAAAFRGNYALVHRMLREYGVEEALLDDAAQEVFLVVHRRWQDYDGRAAFRRWLLGITRRVASDYRRASRRARARLDKLSPRPRPASPERRVQTRQAVETIERFLAGLDARQREVFVLAEIQGMTAPEISELLGVKVNTVYSRLRLARERFDSFIARERAKEDHARAE